MEYSTIYMCSVSREKVALDFFRFFFLFQKNKKKKKKKLLIEIPILLLRKYKTQYYNSVFRFITFYFAPDVVLLDCKKDIQTR